MLGLGTPEILLILVIIVIVFGVGKLPEVGSGMGRAIRNFKKAMSDTDIDTAASKELKK
ncbi:twin-arginine translocase TatA/TatE family subunit [bacterium]|nr:MAG: twin-arginine translocase TatA/TatE family subunit [bacterium]